jgi:hypothetical protein
MGRDLRVVLEHAVPQLSGLIDRVNIAARDCSAGACVSRAMPAAM